MKKLADNRRGMLRCEFITQPKAKIKNHRYCGMTNSKPYITGKVGGPVPQPAWRCDNHKPKKREEVNFWNGKPKSKA